MMHVEVRNTCPTRPNVNNWFYVCVGESTFNLIRVFKWIGSSLRANSLQIGISFKPSKTSGHQKQLQQPSWGQRRASRQTNLSWSGCWTGPLRPSSQGCWGWTVSPGRCPPWPGLWLFWRTNETAGVVAEWRLCTDGWFKYVAKHQRTYLPSNLCFKKSNRAFCIMSVTWRRKKVRILDQKAHQLEFFFVQYKDGGKRTSKPFRDGPIRITGRIVGTTSYMATCSPCRHHPASHEEHVCLITHSCTIGFSSGFWLAALKTDQEFRSHSQNVLQYAAGLNARTTSLLCCRARSAGAL